MSFRFLFVVAAEALSEVMGYRSRLRQRDRGFSGQLLRLLHGIGTA
jgi:hypothetical protein